MKTAVDCNLYSAEQMRTLDRLAIGTAGIPGYELMQRAGTAAWQVLQARWPDARRVQVLCSTGNNGGDGYVVARLAQAAGLEVAVLQAGDPVRIGGDAATARDAAIAAGVEELTGLERVSAEADVIVDGLLGTGLDRAPGGRLQALIESANNAAAPVLALDLPSGLNADTGHTPGVCIQADVTVTFIGRKCGLVTGNGPAVCGEVEFAALDVPEEVYAQVPARARLLRQPALGTLSRPRARTAHKGDNGRVLVVGGGQGMPGAVRLCGEAALRSGAGLVSVATRASHAAQVAAACPELICHPVEDVATLQALLQSADVVAVGPGLGRSDWARTMLGCVLESDLPRVLDADALNLLATDPVHFGRQVLTPHPGEAARLLRQGTGEVQADRFAAAGAISEQYGGVTVLKGAGSVICTADGHFSVCASGNPGMASAGMGDVLAGVIVALLAQGLGPAEAAAAGVCLHACAGDSAAEEGERGLLARDVIAALRSQLRQYGGGR